MEQLEPSSMMQQDRPVILFDGVCNLCEWSVQFVFARDRTETFLFASLQSKIGETILRKHQLDSVSLATLVLYEKGRVFTRSTAVLQIARRLSGLWPMVSVFLLVPTNVRDLLYRIMSRYRYVWFGKMHACWVPTDDQKARFLE